MGKIAVIGSGLAGNAFFSGIVGHLQSGIGRNVEIHVFDSSGEFGTGIYKTTLPDTCLLNLENDNMGWVAPGDFSAGPDHFYKYLQENVDRLVREDGRLDVNALSDPNGYTPRFVYGRYLKEAFQKCEALAAACGIQVWKHSAFVEDIRIMGGKTALVYSDEAGSLTEEGFDLIFLAVGHWKPALPDGLARSAKYIPSTAIQRLADRTTVVGATVGVIGTGLSGVDAALTALKHGAAKVVMTSRRGRLRAVKGRTVKYDRKFLKREIVDNYVKTQGHITLAQVVELFLREYETALSIVRGLQDSNYFEANDWFRRVRDSYYVPTDQPELHDFIFPNDPIAQLKYHVAESEACPETKGLLWISITESMYDMEDGIEFGDYIYQRMPDNDKTTFMQRFFGPYYNFNAAMPLLSAKRILDHHNAGVLDVIKGFQGITRDDGRGQFRIDFYDGNPIHVDVVVDATGQTNDLTLHPLYARLIQAGTAVPHPAGGVIIDLQTHAMLAADGTPLPVLVATGTATYGSTYVLKPDSIGIADSSLRIAEYAYRSLLD